MRQRIFKTRDERIENHTSYQERKHHTSVSGMMLGDLITDIANTASGHKLQNGEFRKHPVEPRWHCPLAYVCKKIEMPNFTMEYLMPVHARNERVVLQLHGGGYIGPMKNVYRDFAVYYSRALGGGNTLTVDYRVAPEHPFPAALEDAYAAYQWLLLRYPARKILVAGDSAGGGLALALIHYLKEKKQPLPVGLIAMSPWTDLTAGGESYRTNFEKDPLFGRTEDSMLFHMDYVGDADRENPLISPLFGEFEKFPPLLLQVGGNEMLLSDTLGVRDKARAAGVPVRCTIYEGMFHLFQMAKAKIPESRDAWYEICRMLSPRRQRYLEKLYDQRKK